MQRRIEAAGGVLWRPADTRMGVEVAIVHRPEHDDWSLPKGKLLPDEHPLLGALREVAEETGFTASVGPRLGATRYTKNGDPKRVRYWAMRAESGEFAVSKEVDDLLWLPPDAATRLARHRDRTIIGTFGELRPDRAWPLLLVRHGSAVSGGRWKGVDHQRPLDGPGRRQANALADLLDAYGVQRVLTADVRRCKETLLPLAKERDVEVESEPLFEARNLDRRTDAAVARLTDLAMQGVPTVVCAKQRVLMRLCDELSWALGRKPSNKPSLPKAGFYALHLHERGPVRVSPPERFAAHSRDPG